MMGIISFGIALVAGKNRVPRPAAGITAFLISAMSQTLSRVAPNSNLEDDVRMLVLLILSQLLSPATHASDFQSPRAASLGGAGHAHPLGNDAIFQNPAYTPFIPATSLGVYWVGWQNAPSTDYGRNYSVSLQDGRSELFQAGIAHTQRDNGRFLNFGIAKSLMQGTGIGIGGKFYFPNNANWVLTDAIASITGVFSTWFHASLTVDNIFESPYSPQLGLSREWILGTKFNAMGIVTLYLDPIFLPSLSSQNQWGFESGAEFHVMVDLNLRAGLFQNSMIPYLAQRGRGWSAGFGWNGPRISIDYAHHHVQQATVEGEAWSNSIGTTMYF